MKNYFQTSNFTDFDLGSLRNTSLPEPNVLDFKLYTSKVEGFYRRKNKNALKQKQLLNEP
jgi:hypothetical protein